MSWQAFTNSECGILQPRRLFYNIFKIINVTNFYQFSSDRLLALFFLGNCDFFFFLQLY